MVAWREITACKSHSAQIILGVHAPYLICIMYEVLQPEVVLAWTFAVAGWIFSEVKNLMDVCHFDRLYWGWFIAICNCNSNPCLAGVKCRYYIMKYNIIVPSLISVHDVFVQCSLKCCSSVRCGRRVQVQSPEQHLHCWEKLTVQRKRYKIESQTLYQSHVHQKEALGLDTDGKTSYSSLDLTVYVFF